MGLIIRSTIFVLVLWVVSYVGLQVLGVYLPENKNEILVATTMLVALGSGVGSFFGPVVQLAFVVTILLYAAEKAGLLQRDASGSLFSRIASASNIQAFIAIVIIVSLAIAALSGIGDISVLKDLALVVVGFYFGTKRQSDADELLKPESAQDLMQNKDKQS
ncbi:hypothetical protein [Pseudomonas sp. R5(2019)]|uniref:hypothetical protein n=1 Tax=Pseudomonas sp. R5(2019) TaxID=2697566 RepID=UPI001412F071|nr:hypothetical protein [Pseudomonas sp. R5(2019)]NBA95651.1 hypothetical protein [Pseudomonas sp. R5(2019)]